MRRYQATPRKQAGFTLVEIAIVLVIIGLLLGGVLKGQELITQAKIKNVSNDLNGITAAVYSYQDRYKRLPGDDGGATRWPLIAANPPGATAGNNVVEGNYNSATATDESRLFWAELRLAGFIAGQTDTIANATVQPLNAANGILGVQQGALGLSGLTVCASGLPTKIAQALDVQMDDGSLKTGSVRAQIEGATPPTDVGTAAPGAVNDYVDNGTNLYVVCKNI